jgi:hypothetical protein
MKKKKKSSNEVTDIAVGKTGTAGTDETDPPQPSPADLGLKSAHLAKVATKRRKVVAA